LDKLRKLPDSVFHELISVWETAPPDASVVKGLSNGDVSELREGALELYRVREYYHERIPEFAASIAIALQEDSGFPESELPAFGERLEKVLSITPLGTAAKAQSLGTEYERRFCTARILTDARPVYIGSPSTRPEAMMITHTLRITFHDDTGEMREIYITMDNDDLVTLRGLVDRAEAKTKSLQAVFANSNIPIVLP
jgi:hypothetical protein